MKNSMVTFAFHLCEISLEIIIIYIMTGDLYHDLLITMFICAYVYLFI